MPKYAFQLGTNKALSLAEILTTAPQITSFSHEDEVAVIELEKDIDAQKLMNRMGGTIRILEIVEELEINPSQDRSKNEHQDQAAILNEVFTAETVSKHAFTNDARSFNLGALNIKQNIARTLSGIGISLKKELKKINIKSRYVESRQENILSSAAAFQNDLHTTKSELVAIKTKKAFLLARTAAIQDIEDYSKRDEFRPHRDKKLGMLPVKLAQILLNLSATKDQGNIYDPFCGLGTILQEALRDGYNAYGSDANEEVVTKAQENLKWFQKEYPTATGKVEIKLANAKTVTNTFNAKMNAVVTEGYLGKTFFRTPEMYDLNEEHMRLKVIYIEALKALKTGFFEPNSRVVLCTPFYRFGKEEVFAPWLDTIRSLGYTQLDLFPKDAGIIPPSDFNVPRKTFLYARPDAQVGREISIWTI
jgi:tRNA G10  N-methylase Trm11